MRRLIPRPSPAMVVACIALLVALGGTGVSAVSQLVPRNSVGTSQLRSNAVTTPKIRNNAITSAKVRNQSLLALDFAQGQLPQGPKGDPGPKGDTGERGPKGDPGSPGVSGLETVTTTTAFDSTNVKMRTTSCPAGKRVLGGGGFVNTVDQAAPVALRRANPVGTSWVAHAFETTAYAGSWSLSVAVICATVAP